MTNRVYFLLRIGAAEAHVLASHSARRGVEVYIPALGMAEMPQLADQLRAADVAPIDTSFARELIAARFGPCLSLAELAVLQARELSEVHLEPA